jgi:hypothetical protein
MNTIFLFFVYFTALFLLGCLSLNMWMALSKGKWRDGALWAFTFVVTAYVFVTGAW